ncbi:hypothetical protein ARAM_007085 [Aspergillus rambellii]|uniref:Endo-xylogalacturonan hydrolase A n=1 Tax=Aspergillus rambellii TaxID=308745 RepID=A0A0F8U9W9_9EURO|nr:hypothetical protein ARAM_007085 [Aspergillus rambellii]
MFFFQSVVLLGLVGASWANPSGVQQARAVCTPKAGGSPKIDDVPAITKAFASCGHGGTIIIPKGSTYHLNSVLDLGGCSNCDFQIEGLLKFTGSTSYWNGKYAMINIHKITGLKMRSLTGAGVVDGSGQDSWDLFASNSNYRRPTLLGIGGSSNLEVSNLRLTNPPNVFVSVKSGTEHAVFSGLRLDARSVSRHPAINTDGFNIGQSTHVRITKTTVANDDDCIAFQSGSSDITVQDITCRGSHGLSVGSLGKTNADTVQNIWIEGATMIGCSKAAGIKTYPGGAGAGHGQATVRNVTWADVDVQACDYAIQIQSCYGTSPADCEKHPGDAVLEDVTFTGFTGTTNSKYGSALANLNCGARGTCGVTVRDFSVKAPSGKGEVLCGNTPSHLGVACTSGASG